MNTFRYLTLIFSLMVPFAAASKDLPNGEFALVGNVFPGIWTGNIGWTYAHIKTGGDEIEWTFSKPYMADALACNTWGKCQRHVSNLRHKVSWFEDGIVAVLETEIDTSPGLAIERPDVDGDFILGEVVRALNGAYMELGSQGGGILPANDDRIIYALPITFQDFDDALALTLSFEQNLNQTNQCGLIQVLSIMANPEPSSVEAELVLAAKFHGELQDRRDRAYFYEAATVPAEKEEEIKVAKAEVLAWEMALANGQSFGNPSVFRAGRVTDEDLIAYIESFMVHLKPQLGDEYRRVQEEMLVQSRKELLAAIRLARRVEHSKRFIGFDMLEAFCTDITFGQVKTQN